MITGIKKSAIVGQNGRIEIATSELPEGASVEIIILMDSSNKPSVPPQLRAALERVEARQDLVTFTPDEWNAQYHL
jgi:antitoxin YefM